MACDPPSQGLPIRAYDSQLWLCLWTIVQATSLGSGGHAPLVPASQRQTLIPAVATLGRTFRWAPNQKTRTILLPVACQWVVSVGVFFRVGGLSVFVKVKVHAVMPQLPCLDSCVLCNANMPCVMCSLCVVCKYDPSIPSKKAWPTQLSPPSCSLCPHFRICLVKRDFLLTLPVVH